MGILSFFKKNKKEDLPFIARVDLVELQKKREKEVEDREVSILASADFTKKLPKIRLYYVALSKFNRYAEGEIKVGQTHGISSPFYLPRGMTIEDACKVVSYLSEKVEKEFNYEPASEDSVAMVSKKLRDFGFDKKEGCPHGHFHAVGKYPLFSKIKSSFEACDEIESVVDLFSVGGDFKVFKKTELHDRYFDWFTPNVTEQEIIDIYKKINKEDYLYLAGIYPSRTAETVITNNDGSKTHSVLFLDKKTIIVDDEKIL